MLRVDLAKPMLGLVVDRKGLLSRRNNRLWNRDTNVRDAATALAIEKYEVERFNQGFGEDDDDEESGLIRFLNWLIENQDQIKALIEMIMSLFNTEAPNVTT